MNYKKIFIVLGLFLLLFVLLFVISHNIAQYELFNGCLSGETDDTTKGLCLQRFCPEGLEQGYYQGAHLCYEPCADGYISNGNDKCYKLADMNKFYVRDEHPIPYSITHNVYRYFFPLTKCY